MTELAGSLTPGGIVLLKTFIAGIVLGIVASAGVLYAYPAVDQQRVASIISVAANGGNSEAFHVNVPMDRVLVAPPGQRKALPQGLEWPDDEVLTDMRVELFKIRNARDIVIGVAARTAAKDGATDVIDWVLHIPARGSFYVTMQPQPLQGGYRRGELRAGSREFAPLTGSMTERWVSDTSGDEGAPSGRIELDARYVGQQEEL